MLSISINANMKNRKPMATEVKNDKSTYRLRQIEIHSMPDDSVKPINSNLLFGDRFEKFDKEFKAQLSKIWVRDVLSGRIFLIFESEIIKSKFINENSKGERFEDYRLFYAQEAQTGEQECQQN